MPLLSSLITDFLHIIKFFLLYDIFFNFELRHYKQFKQKICLISTVMSVFSLIIYFQDSTKIDTILYFFLLFLLFSLLYKEKKINLFLSTFWIAFISNLLDMMVLTFVEISINIFFKNYNIFTDDTFDLLVCILSLVVAWFLRKIYKKALNNSTPNLSVNNLLLFTLILITDTIVIMLMLVTVINKSLGNYRLLFSIAFIGVILGVFIQLSAVILLFAQKNIYMEKSEITRKYLNAQKNHYEYLKNREIETKKFRHDLKSHMQILSDLVYHKEYDKFDKYLKEMDIQIEHFGNIITINNEIADAVINQYYEIATKQGIKMQIKGLFPANCNIDAYDLCTIFSNILSNSVEASIKSIEKNIYLECRYTEKHIIIILKNSYLNIGQFDNKAFKTLKEDENYHGFGLTNIKDSINKYNGMLSINISNNEFLLKIILNYARKGNQ